MLATLNKKSGNEFRRLPYKIGKPFCTFYDEGLYLFSILKMTSYQKQYIFRNNVYARSKEGFKFTS